MTLSSAIHLAVFFSFALSTIPRHVLSFVNKPLSFASRPNLSFSSKSSSRSPKLFKAHLPLNSLNIPIADTTTSPDDDSNIVVGTGGINTDGEIERKVPTKLSEAVRVFFTHDYGPLYVVLTLSLLSTWRLHLATTGAFPLHGMDLFVFGGAVVFWWFQEHFLHQRVLHSKFDWIGKRIHEGHHAQPYYHVSIEPAGLIMGWLTVSFFIFNLLLPSLSLSISATIGYALAGLFYEWSHYLVHTRVPLSRSTFWTRIKANHVRHHVVNHNYWFGFSLPWIDDLFCTNPSVKDVKRVVIGKQ